MIIMINAIKEDLKVTSDYIVGHRCSLVWGIRGLLQEINMWCVK